MMEAIKKLLSKPWMPAIISLLVVGGTFALYGYLIVHGNPTGLDDLILGRILGTADMSFGVALAYWLGTSSSSRAKDDTIKSLTNTPP